LKGIKNVENGEARVNDTFDAEPHSTNNRTTVETAEADDNGFFEIEFQTSMDSKDVQQ